MSKDNKYERKVRCKGHSFFFKLNNSCTLSCSHRLNFARSLLIFCLVQSVSTSEAKSSALASSSSFIFTEGDLVNKQILLRQITVESIVKYRAICCSINQSVLVNQSVLRPIYTVRLCRMRQTYDRPTTWLRTIYTRTTFSPTTCQNRVQFHSFRPRSLFQ